MKIAWRYERLGEFGAGAGSRATPTPSRNPVPSNPAQSDSTVPTPFCHSFDLTKRLSLPTPNAILFINTSPPAENPFPPLVQSITQAIASSPPNTIHRLIIPTLLSPALFPPSASQPTHLLPFLHSLRALLRHHSTRLTAMLTLPLALYPRSTGLVRWIEHLCDGVFELVPFPHSIDIEPPLTTSSGSGKAEEKPQGMLRIHKVPVLTEKGGGGGGGDDLAFSLSRRRFVIKPFSLPPVEGDQEAQKGEAEGAKVGKGDIEF
ncbi:Elongator complex protein 4 [Usnea florida]